MGESEKTFQLLVLFLTPKRSHSALKIRISEKNFGKDE